MFNAGHWLGIFERIDESWFSVSNLGYIQVYYIMIAGSTPKVYYIMIAGSAPRFIIL